MLFATVAPIVSTAAAQSVRMDDLAGILVVKTMVNGKGPFNFVLDTGAGITVITPDLAKKLDLKANAAGSAHGMGEKTVSIQTLPLARVSVGAATQENVAAAIIPLPADLTYQGNYGTIDGIVGYTFLKNYAVTIDIADSRASFTPPVAFTPPAGVQPVPLVLAEGRIPVVNASVEGATGSFELDSGNNRDADVTESFAQAHGTAKAYGAGVNAQYEGIGGYVAAKRVRLSDLRLGSFELHGVPAEVSAAKGGVLVNDRLDGNFGYAVLRQFEMTVDYGGARLYLTRSAQFDSFKPAVGTGIIPKRNADGTMQVVGLIDGSPAARAAIKTGETIVAIDGRSVATMSTADYRAAVGTVAGGTVTYTLRSGTSVRRVPVVTADLLPAATENASKANFR